MSAERPFRFANGLDIAHVPFVGGGPAIASTFTGHTLIAVTALPAAAPYIKDGSLRALAITANKRSAAFPDMPTLEEAGFAGQASDFFVGAVAQAGTQIVDLLYREIARIAASPDVKQRLATLDFEIVVNTSDEFAVRIKSDTAKWEKVARAIKIQKQ